MDLIEGTPIKTGALTPTASTRIPLADMDDANGVTKANAVLISVEAFPVRVNLTGAAATAAAFHSLPVGYVGTFAGEIVSKLRFIDTAAGASTVRYTTLRM